MAYTSSASLTLAQSRTLMAFLMQDESATAPFLAPTTPTSTSPYTKDNLLRDWYILWCEKFNLRRARLGGTATFGAMTAGTGYYLSTDASIIVVREAHRIPNSDGGSSFKIGQQLERMDPNRVRYLQATDTTQAPPTCVAFERLDARSNSDAPGFTAMYVWPLPDAAYFVPCIVDGIPRIPVTDGDLWDGDGSEIRVVCHLAAIQGAAMAGRDSEFLENLWRYVPLQQQDIMRREMTGRMPGSRAAASQVSP